MLTLAIGVLPGVYVYARAHGLHDMSGLCLDGPRDETVDRCLPRDGGVEGSAHGRELSFGKTAARLPLMSALLDARVTDLPTRLLKSWLGFDRQIW